MHPDPGAGPPRATGSESPCSASQVCASWDGVDPFPAAASPLDHAGCSSARILGPLLNRGVTNPHAAGRAGPVDAADVPGGLRLRGGVRVRGSVDGPGDGPPADGRWTGWTVYTRLRMVDGTATKWRQYLDGTHQLCPGEYQDVEDALADVEDACLEHYGEECGY